MVVTVDGGNVIVLQISPGGLNVITSTVPFSGEDGTEKPSAVYTGFQPEVDLALQEVLPSPTE